MPFRVARGPVLVLYTRSTPVSFGLLTGFYSGLAVHCTGVMENRIAAVRLEWISAPALPVPVCANGWPTYAASAIKDPITDGDLFARAP